MMKVLKREPIDSTHLMPGDTLILKMNEDILLETNIGRQLTVDEVVVFNVEEGDFKGAKDGIGGAFLSSKGE